MLLTSLSFARDLRLLMWSSALRAHHCAAGSYYMWRVPTQNLVKGKPGSKKKAKAAASAVPNI